jgi:hypothetical protein
MLLGIILDVDEILSGQGAGIRGGSIASVPDAEAATLNVSRASG